MCYDEEAVLIMSNDVRCEGMYDDKWYILCGVISCGVGCCNVLYFPVM